MKRNIRFFVMFCLGPALCCLAACSPETGAGAAATAFSGAFVQQGRPAAGLADYRITYYEPALIADTYSSGAVQESDDPFVMADYGPRELLPAEIKKPSIYVIFSQPVVPLAQLGEPITEGAELFTIEPPLPGVYRWYGTKLLAFEPDAESLPHLRYTITVSGTLTSMGGKALQGPRSFTFETERLSALEWQLGEGVRRVDTNSVHPEDAKYIRLIFSYPVNLDEIARWIEVRAAGKTWPFTLGRLPGIDEQRYHINQGVLLTVNDTLPFDTDVIMTLKTGARAEPDWLGAGKDTSWNYHTLLPFAFSGVSTHNYSRPSLPDGYSISVFLDFNQTVEPGNAEKYISVNGFPALKKENVEIHGSTATINGLPLKYENEYTVEVSADLRDIYGRALGDVAKITVNTGEPASYVRIKDYGPRMLEAEFAPKVVWEAQNPVSLQFGAAAAQSPYGRLPLTGLRNVDTANKYFMENLAPFLNAAGKGSVALRWDYKTKSSWEPGRIDSGNSWLTVQVTNIGITARYAYNMALVWATHLSDGSPAENAKVELLENENVIVSGSTDERGLAVFEFPGGDFVSRFSRPNLNYWGRDFSAAGFRIRVSEGEGGRIDRAEFIPNDSHNIWRFDVRSSGTPFTAEQEHPVALLFTDRGLYRPGETVSFRGIDRSMRLGQYTAYQGPYQIEVTSRAYRAPVLVTLNGETSANGGSSGSFTLPETLNPGEYYINYRRVEIDNDSNENPGTGARRQQQASVPFTVARFQRLRFESSLRFADSVAYQGDTLNAALSAAYLSGGGLSGAAYTWHLTREPAFHLPGGTDGVWRNWHFGPELDDNRAFIGRGEGVLDPDGKSSINHATVNDGIAGAAYRYRLETAVQDAARQEIAANAAVVVHPASFYIAARLDSGTPDNTAPATGENPSAFFVGADQAATVSWALVSPRGEPYPADLAGELSIQVARYEWKQARQAGTGGRINLVWERVEEIVEQRAEKITKAYGQYHFTPNKSGLWEIRVQGRDNQQRLAATRFSFYVSGAGWVRWSSQDIDTISLTTGRPAYTPGETARILVRSPLEKGKYLLTLEREGIISQKIIELDGSALTIDIPVEESYMPVVYAALSAYTVRSGSPRNNYHEPDLDKPKGIFGVTPVYVDHSSRHYQIEITPDKTGYRPAEEAAVKIQVLLNGKPAPDTEVSFMAVDRGVLDLINYHLPDPAAFFYDPERFPLGVSGADSRSILIDPVTYSLSDLQGGGGTDDAKMEGSEAGSGMNTRMDFRPTAVFEPNLITGEDGTVTVKFTLPDSLTTYRCTAVAAGLRHFGIKEHEVRVSAPLTATAALPRKLRWRDTGTVSLILTNLEQSVVEARVELSPSGMPEGAPSDTENAIIAVDGENAKNVKIQPGASVEVPFKVAATGIGEAGLVFTLRSPRVNETIVKTIVVDRPVLTETVTTAGNLSADADFIEEGMALPSLVPEGTGEVVISLSASRLASLKETVNFLLNYPYGCIEQRTARLMPMIAFGEHIEALGGPQNPKKIIESEIEDISKSQLSDGSFPYWPGGQRGDIFVSMRVAHIAALAKAKNMTVPESLDTRLLLAYITAATVTKTFNNKPLPQDPFLKGYSLWVRAIYGERIGSEISAFLKQGDELGISGWAFAGLAALELGQKDLAASTRDRVLRFIRPGTRGLDLADTLYQGYAERQGNYWGGDTDRYALALMLFQTLTPDDEYTGRLATSLIDRQRGGVWNNTASAYWALLALGMSGDSESAAWQAGGGRLTAEVSLGGSNLFNAEFKTYGSAPVSYNGTFAETPLKDLERDTVLPLRIERNGAGSLYYTASLRYGIPLELAGARDEGLGVFMETFDSEGNPVKDGKLEAGKTYTRRVIVSSSRDRAYVALRSPVPSGAEIIDAAFITSSTVPPPAEEIRDGYWNHYQPEPVQFMLDDEARFHWDFFRAGRQQVEFRFRAVMPGVYPTPPAVAECMYEAEVFGRAAGELIRID